MSETRRVTVNGIEWLYTISEADKALKSIVLEKAILLTSDQYEMTINVADIVWAVAPSYIYYNEDTRKEYLGCDWIVKIGASAFEGNEYLTKMTIQDGYWQEFSNNKIYLTICTKAFKNCSNLQGIFCEEMYDNVYPRGRFILHSIEDSAFENCGPDSSESFRLFSGGNSACITSYELMSTVTNIGARAFYGVNGELSWEQLYDSGVRTENMVVGVSLDSLKDLGEEAFGHSSVFGRIKLPPAIKIIKSGSFVMYVGEVCYSKGLESIESCAFQRADLKSYGKSTNTGVVEERGTVILPDGLISIGDGAFDEASFEKVILPSTIKVIGASSFRGRVEAGVYYSVFKGPLVVPRSVEYIGLGAFSNNPNLERVIFEGLPPMNVSSAGFMSSTEVLVPLEYESQWRPFMFSNMKFAKKVDGEWVALGGKVISNTMRPSDPTIMDIKYKVTSTKDKVNVRILAFEDGNRSFAKVLRPETFVDGTEANVGDGVAANVEHTVSWQVSKDWDADLAKVSVEVFVMEDNLLPLQLTTIPAKNGHPSVTFSRNEQSGEKVMNALYWLYADKTSDLTLENGVIKGDGKQLANGTTFSTENAVSYIYSKMGYGTLSGDTLKYVNDLMRSSISSGKFAVKEGAAE